MGSWQWDTTTQVLTWSEELYKLHGLDPTFPLPAPEECERLFAGDGWQKVRASMTNALESGVLHDVDVEIIRPDGSKRWISTRGQAMRDASGKITLLRGTSQDITERKRVEARLREYEKAVEATGEMIVVVDRSYRYTLVNNTYLVARGTSREQILGRTIPEVVGSHAFEHDIKDKLDEAFNGRVVRYEIKATYPSRGERDIFVSYFPIEAPAGVEHVACILEDTTERNAVERKLRESEERFRRVVEQIPDALIVDDVMGNIVYANERFLQQFGYIREQLTNITMFDIIAPEYRSEMRARHQRRMRGEPMISRYEFEGVRADGTRLWLDGIVTTIKDESGNIIGTQKIARDITDRRRAEEALKESEERFRLVANTAPVMIWMSGTDKLCTYFNKQWLDFTGRSLEVELGDGWTDGIHEDDRYQCLTTYVESFDSREAFPAEYRLRRQDGEYRWLLDRGVPRFNPDGTFAGYIGSCLDVTERKLAEEALASIGRRLIEAHEQERAWIGRELHDDISQSLALLAVELDRHNKQPSSSSQVIERVQGRIAEISRDVQALSHRLHSSKLDYLGLAAAANSFCNELSAQTGVQIRFKYSGIPRDLPKEVSLCLFRVLQESLQNAVKHSEVKQFTVELYGSPGSIELLVQDEGVGFEEEEAMASKGLGLISMRERLQMVNGHFSIESRIGGGTTVRASVPVEAEESRAIAS